MPVSVRLDKETEELLERTMALFDKEDDKHLICLDVFKEGNPSLPLGLC